MTTTAKRLHKAHIRGVRHQRETIAQRALGLPPVHSKAVPGYVLIADRDNNRALIVSPSKRVVWQERGLRGPDDAFFTPGYRSVITNEEFNHTLTEVALRGKRRLWHYGHAGIAGSSPGYLNTPDDAYRLSSGLTVAADIRNCRIVYLRRSGAVARTIGAAVSTTRRTGSRPKRLASLAVRWPNGLIAANDDYNHRVIVIDPRTKRIVWQYGHTGGAGEARGYLDKPDGIDLLPG